jgi:hypothetical protein
MRTSMRMTLRELLASSDFEAGICLVERKRDLLTWRVRYCIASTCIKNNINSFGKRYGASISVRSLSLHWPRGETLLDFRQGLERRVRLYRALEHVLLD